MLPLLTSLIHIIISAPLTTAVVSWLGRLIARAVARQLQVPEALVHEAGRYVYARIDCFERQLLHGLIGHSS